MTGSYLDTSVLIAALIDERSGDAARRALAADHARRPLISDWTLVEFSSALGLKVRRRDLPEDRALAAVAFLDVLSRFDLALVPVEREHHRRAGELCRHFGHGLRGPDALHLAVAAAHGATVLTLDEGMWRGGRTLGLAVALLA